MFFSGIKALRRNDFGSPGLKRLNAVLQLNNSNLCSCYSYHTMEGEYG
jgi:hypothetical protein